MYADLHSHAVSPAQTQCEAKKTDGSKSIAAKHRSKARQQSKAGGQRTWSRTEHVLKQANVGCDGSNAVKAWCRTRRAPLLIASTIASSMSFGFCSNAKHSG